MAPAPSAADQSEAAFDAEESSSVELDMLTRLMIKPERTMSIATHDCLKHLRSPLARTSFRKTETNDISRQLQPLRTFTLLFINAQQAMRNNLSSDSATNFEALRLQLRKDSAVVQAGAAFRNFFAAISIDFEEKEIDNLIGTQDDIEDQMTEEINVVWDAILQATQTVDAVLSRAAGRLAVLAS